LQRVSSMLGSTIWQEDANKSFLAYNVPVRYQQTPEKEFRSQLEAKMGPATALDFTEQLMIFEACGMIYDNPEFVQASKVRHNPATACQYIC
jgi:hypothetical protein